LDEADQLFAAGRYDEAGRGYAALARQDRLPAERRPHWAYCRWMEVVRRINNHPRSAREWDEIEAEIRSTQRLTPGNWYGEYLRSKVAEVRRRGPTAPSDSLIVRGSAPEEAQAPTRRFPRLFGRSRAPAAPAPRPGLAVTSPSAPTAPDQPLNLPRATARSDADRDSIAGGAAVTAAASGAAARPGGAPADNPPTGEDPPPSHIEDGVPVAGKAEAEGPSAISWRIHDTPNFRIHHCDPTLARRAAEVVESVRTAQAKRWTSPTARSAWAPRCELYLYPTSRSYSLATGQPESSPGISTLSNNEIRILSRRMDLHTDNPQWLSTILPHEVTHVVLADLFVARRIPRWADEGLAVLAEPPAEQQARAAELKGAMEAGDLFELDQLMTIDYPKAEDWRVYYAQSVSLTRYLVEQGPPERFIRFLQQSQRGGAEAALRDVYQIGGLPNLQERWVAYAQDQVAVAIAAGRGSETRPPATQRR
jgi:hypothetical protein